MQKKIIALAIAAAFAAPVTAMADVAVYGTIDGGLRHQTQESATAPTVTTDSFGSGVYNSNRWGIKASDDLGDGMKANVVLEGGLNIGNGAAGSPNTVNSTITTSTNANGSSTSLVFDRQSTVGISTKDMGAVDLGRQNAVAFKTAVALNPFGSNYIGLNYVIATTYGIVRYDRDISYTGNFGGLKVMAERAMDNAVGNGNTAGGVTAATTAATTGQATAVGLSYTAGPINVAGAYTGTESSVGNSNNNPNKNTNKNWIVGGTFTFGDAKVFVATNKGVTNNNAAGDETTKVSWLGASYNVSSKVGVTAALYKSTFSASATAVESNSQRVMIGATYAMSKLTKLYAGADTETTNTGISGAAGLKTSGVSLGLATAF